MPSRIHPFPSVEYGFKLGPSAVVPVRADYCRVVVCASLRANPINAFAECNYLPSSLTLKPHEMNRKRKEKK